MSTLLPANALKDVRLGLSVSESPDLLRLGLLETHFRLALGELARCVLTAQGKLAYGGHLRPNGYTAYLARELERYSRRDRPLRVCLAWSEHRKLALTALEQDRKSLGLFGEIVCLDQGGAPTDPATGRTEQPQPPLDAQTERQSLSGLRRYMTQNTNGRILIGGKRSDFLGDMPGVLEEALLTMEAGQPLYLAAGFGGVTWDIANALGLSDAASLPSPPNAPAPDQRLVDNLGRLVQVCQDTRGVSLDNGLSEAENRQLAASYRPSEIAALVGLGLGRRFSPARK